MNREATIAWCENCWMYGRTEWVERSDGMYECTICHQVKQLSGMKHGGASRQNCSNVQVAEQSISHSAD